MRKSPVRKGLFFVLVLAALSLVGCCKFTPEKQAMTKASLEMLQGGYDTSVGYLSDPAVDLVDPKTLAAMKMIQGAAKLAVPLVDGALDQLGKVLAAKCPDQAAVTKALSDAALAQRAQNKVLNLAGQPAAVNPTAAPAPAPAN